MSQRIVAIIDADLNLAQHLQGELERNRLAVEIAADSNELMSRKEDLPSLVVLCIDPKRTGWAVCNRLRKSPLLKSIPLIITSAEATEKDFDDHKKLKTRAEEYLHKPFSADALIDKIATLIGLPEPEPVPEEAAEIELEPEEIAAADIEAEEISEEVAGDDEMTMGGNLGATVGDDERTRIGFAAEIDGEVDLETNAAFAAIGLDEPAEGATAAGGDSPFDDDPFALPDPPPAEAVEEAPATTSAPRPEAVAATSGPVVTAPIHNTPPPADLDSAPVPKVAAEELDLGLDEVARGAEAIVASSASKQASGDALGDARKEIDRLKKENDELRARPKEAAPAQSSSFSREREFLTLRETINKKEKEVLDLRDSLDSKERQILDGKDRLREAERKLREHDETSLSAEREFVAAREKIEALTADKERSVEREKQTKGRLEDAQKAVTRFEQELEQWKGKHSSDVAAVEEKLNTTIAKYREEMGALRQANAEGLADLKTQHDSQLAAAVEAHGNEKQSLIDAHENTLAEIHQEHTQAISQKVAEHKSALDNEIRAVERRHAEATVDLEGKHELAIKAAESRHQDALRAHGEEAARNLEQAVGEHQAERARLEGEHARTVESLEAAKQQALAQAAATAAEQLTAAVAQKAAEDENEMKSLRDQHARKLQALEESHEDLRAGMLTRHNAAVDELKKAHAGSISELEGQVAERDQGLVQARERQSETEQQLAASQEQNRNQAQLINELSGQLEQSKNEVEARGKTIEERNHRVAELEQESARYQDQILRAYQRIKADESIVARAKKALAIALTLLEESDEGGGEDAAS